MTKVYLVTIHECDEDGKVVRNGRTIIDEVFTNKKLAIAYINNMNKIYWKYQKTWYWWWEERTICKANTKKLLF